MEKEIKKLIENILTELNREKYSNELEKQFQFEGETFINLKKRGWKKTKCEEFEKIELYIKYLFEDNYTSYFTLEKQGYTSYKIIKHNYHNSTICFYGNCETEKDLEGIMQKIGIL